MVAVADSTPREAPTGLVKASVIPSSGSDNTSAATRTVTDLLVSPDAKVNRPDGRTLLTKSPALAGWVPVPATL